MLLDFTEAAGHPQNQARGSLPSIAGVVQPGPAPRFSRTPSAVQSSPPTVGEDTSDGLAAWGFDAAEIDALLGDKAIGWQG